MSAPSYFGGYFNFYTDSKKQGALLLGSDCIVGDFYSLNIEFHQGKRRCWIVNKFKKRIGWLNPEDSNTVALQFANNMSLLAILDFVAFSETIDETQGQLSHYWGQVAIIGVKAKDFASYAGYTTNIAKLIGQGIRPDINLSGEALSLLAQKPDTWVPQKRLPRPDFGPKNLVLKSKMSLTDKFVEAGRKKNIWVILVSWTVLLALVSVGVYLVAKSCM